MKSYTLYNYDTSTFGFKELVEEMMISDFKKESGN